LKENFLNILNSKFKGDEINYIMKESVNSISPIHAGFEVNS